MQHRPLLGQVLPGRQPRGVVARVGDLFLGSGAEHARPRLVRDACCGKVTRLRRRPRARCGGFPPADALQRRHPGALRRAAADREGEDRRAAPHPPPRRRGLPAPDRAGARRGRPHDAPAGEVRRQVRDRAGRAQVGAGVGRGLLDRRGAAGRRHRADGDRSRRRARADRGGRAGVGGGDRRLDPPGRGGSRPHAHLLHQGCYPGQEPVARLHYRGHANRGLRVLTMDAPAGRRAALRGQGRRPRHERRSGRRARLRAGRGARRTPSSSPPRTEVPAAGSSWTAGEDQAAQPRRSPARSGPPGTGNGC